MLVETGLATKHWSDKSEGFTWHHQHEEHAIARGFEGMPPRKKLKLHALRLNLRAFSRIYIGVLLTLAVNILYLFLYNIMFQPTLQPGHIY